jgi:hypothetical protein
MSEEEYLRTWGSPNPPPAVVRRVCVTKEAGAWRLTKYVRYTFFTDGPYRTNSQLLQGPYKVNSKHGKVSVAIGSVSYNDGVRQILSFQKRAYSQMSRNSERLGITCNGVERNGRNVGRRLRTG